MLFKKFFEKKITAWANDYHACPVEDAKRHLKPLQVRFVDYSLSGSWRLFHKIDPAWRLKVINRNNVIGPYDYEKFDQLAQLFSDRYGRWINRNIDFFYCSFVPQICHLFRYFSKPILLHISFRFEGNHVTSLTQINKLIELFYRLREEGRLIVAATNRYDVEYFQYFTGIEPIYLPATALYAKHVQYLPRQSEILIGPSRFSDGGMMAVAEMKQWFLSSSRKFSIRTIRDVYPHQHQWSQLAQHPAIIVIPYSIHSFAITEYMAMGIPVFFPSKKFLTELHLKHYIFSERKSNLLPTKASLARPHSAAKTGYDPNNDFDAEALNYWLSFCDWYEWPVIYFDSWEDLAVKLENTNFYEYHKTLKEYSGRQEQEVAELWKTVLSEIMQCRKS